MIATCSSYPHRATTSKPPAWAARLALLAFVSSGLFACKKEQPAGEEPKKALASTAKVSKKVPKLKERPFRFTAPGRVVAIGDLHGDLDATRAALRLAGAIDAEDEWIGGNLTLVQTGDQLDRGDDERGILDLFERLEREAKQHGGAFHVLIGNHETMNVQGDFRYATPSGFAQFSGVSPRSPMAAKVRPPMQDRAAAFLPGGRYAKQLSERNVVSIVNDTVFVHGGVLPRHVEYGIGKLNAEVSAWMQGKLEAPREILSSRSPVWVRDYSEDPPAPNACENLKQVLKKLGAKRMVVGHTVQKETITSACDQRVWRIDVGLSSYYGKRPIQVLSIEGERVEPLSAPR